MECVAVWVSGVQNMINDPSSFNNSYSDYQRKLKTDDSLKNYLF